MNLFRCIKGLTNSHDVVLVKGDLLKFLYREEDLDYYFEVVDGLNNGAELNLSPEQVVEYLEHESNSSSK